MSESDIVIKDKISATTYQSLDQQNQDDLSYCLEKGRFTEFHDKNTKAFDVIHTIGINAHSGFVNLTTSSKECEILYGSSHIAVVYDYKSTKMHTLIGHKNTIRCVSSDSKGQYFVTAGYESDSNIIIWERHSRTPIYFLFEPHKHKILEIMELSGNAKYLVTVGNEPRNIIKFWLWTEGKEEPDGLFETNIEHIGKPKNICFCPSRQEHFMVTFEHQVFFMIWTGQDLEVTTPTIRDKKNYGVFTSSIYVENSYYCITATTHGWTVIWGNQLTHQEFTPESQDNRKIFIRSVKIQNTAINTIVAVDNVIVIGDSDGCIKFYDEKMRILYWCQSFKLKPILSIKFHLYKKQYVFKDPLNFDSETDLDNGMDIDRSLEYERIYAQLVPSDATLNRLPFIVRDFMIMTSDGRIGYVDFLKNTYEEVMHKWGAHITTIETHDERPILLLGFSNGKVTTYDYEHFNVMFENRDLTVQTKDDKQVSISCLKFGRSGHFLACGTSNGYLYFLHPVTLEAVTKPFKVIRNRIVKMCFSSDNIYFAYFDVSKQVVLFKFDEKTLLHTFYSRTAAHSKDIVDIMLITEDKETRIFTVGEDRFIAEYSTQYNENAILETIRTYKIEQSAIPKSIFHFKEPNDPDKIYFFMSNDQYKFKVIIENKDEVICRRTISAPTLDEPIKQMQLIKDNQHFIFRTKKYIGLHRFIPDGNPFKSVAIAGYSQRIGQFAVCKDDRFVFTIGVDDNCCIMWRILYDSVRVMERRGGTELVPFSYLVDGGLHGWLFREMEDLFYYMQILEQGVNSQFPRIVSNKIRLTDLPALMRAIGFFPTEYELNTLLSEIKLDNADSSADDVVTFGQFLISYVNHKPAFGIPLLRLKECFDNFAKNDVIKKERFLNLLCHKGESFKRENMYHCLSLLVGCKKLSTKNRDTSIIHGALPQNITFETLIEMFGIDMAKVPPEGQIQLKPEAK